MAEYSQPRRAPRVALLVEVEVVLVRTRERVRGMTGNVSRTGCYVQSQQTFPLFAQVWVRLFKGTERFEAEASVAHTSAGEGMGISFDEVSAESQAVLDRWLAESG